MMFDFLLLLLLYIYINTLLLRKYNDCRYFTLSTLLFVWLQRVDKKNVATAAHKSRKTVSFSPC